VRCDHVLMWCFFFWAGYRFLLRTQLKSHMNKGEHNFNLSKQEECVAPEPGFLNKRGRRCRKSRVDLKTELDIVHESLLEVGSAVQVEIDSVVDGVITTTGTTGEYEGQTFQLHYYPAVAVGSSDETKQAVANIQVGAIEEIAHHFSEHPSQQLQHL